MNAKKVARNIFMAVIFTLIIVSFAFWGMSKNMLTGVQGNVVLAAGSHQIDRLDYKREFEQLRNQAQQEEKRPVSVDELASQGWDQRLLQQLSTQLTVRVMLEKVGVRPGIEMMADEMRKIPAFFDEVSGRFDRNAYTRVLQENNLDDAKFKEMMGDQISRRHLSSIMEPAPRGPAILAAFQSLLTRQTRDVSVLYITPAMVGAIPTPTDAELTAFMNSNADRLKNPETRVLTIVRFKTADVMSQVNVTDADIQKIIDFRKDQQAEPETRTVVQLTAKDKATADTVAQRLGKGEDAASVARGTGATMTRYDNKPKSAIPDAKIADAAFATASGQTSAPVQGALGFSVVRVLSVTPGKAPDMTKLKADATAEAKQRAAQAKLTEQTDKFDDALNAGKDISEAAQSVGAHVTVTPAIAGNGATRDGAKPEGVSPRVIQEAGGLAANEKSDIIQESPGEYFVVRVDKINPPALPPLAEIKAQLIPAWTAQQQHDKMQAKANEVVAKARETKSLAEAAKLVGGSITKVTGINISDGQALAQKYGPKLVDSAVQAKSGEFFSGDSPPPAGQKGPGTFFVATVDEIHQADPSTVAPEGQRLLQSIAQAQATEAEETFVRSATKLVTVKSYLDRARGAIGLSPEPAGAASKDKAGDKGKAASGAAKK